jgi:hypothetical protein
VAVAVAVAVAAAAVRLSEMNAPVWNVPVCVAGAPLTVKDTVAPSVPQPGIVDTEATSTT